MGGDAQTRGYAVLHTSGLSRRFDLETNAARFLSSDNKTNTLSDPIVERDLSISFISDRCTPHSVFFFF